MLPPYQILFGVVRVASTAYASTETYKRMMELCGDDALSAFAATMVASCGIATTVILPPSETEKLRRLAWAIAQGVLLFGMDALVALCLAEKVQRGLMKMLGGYPVGFGKAFVLVLGICWVLEVLILTAPGQRFESNKKRTHPRHAPFLGD
jgi:hypothetical protein